MSPEPEFVFVDFEREANGQDEEEWYAEEDEEFLSAHGFGGWILLDQGEGCGKVCFNVGF